MNVLINFKKDLIEIENLLNQIKFQDSRIIFEYLSYNTSIKNSFNTIYNFSEVDRELYLLKDNNLFTYQMLFLSYSYILSLLYNEYDNYEDNRFLNLDFSFVKKWVDFLLSNSNLIYDFLDISLNRIYENKNEDEIESVTKLIILMYKLKLKAPNFKSEKYNDYFEIYDKINNYFSYLKNYVNNHN